MVLEQFRNYCGLKKIARCGFPWEKTTKRRVASWISCRAALAENNDVRLSSRKVACSSVAPTTSTGNPGSVYTNCKTALRLGVLILLAVLVSGDRLAVAQGRLDDKDLQQLMANLKTDAQGFRKSFGNALKKSTIRGTSQEKAAQGLADTFAKQANSALETFKGSRKAEGDVTALVNTAAQIDPKAYSLQLNAQTTAQWERLRTELHQIAEAFGVPEAYLAPAQPAVGPPSTTGTCLNAVGIERSRQLVNECLQVSPATHPPCNAQNACSMIVDEIKRGCGLIGSGAPGFCSEYR